MSMGESNQKFNKKLEESLFYEIGEDCLEKVIDETDALHEKYADIEFPESLDTWFDKNHSKLIKQQKKRENGDWKKRFALKRIAIIIVGALALASAVNIQTQAFWKQLYQMVLVENPIYTAITFTEKTDSIDYSDQFPEGASDFYYLTEVPEGFQFEKISENSRGYNTYFSDGEGNKMRLLQMELGGSIQIDTEDAEVIETEINGLPAIISDKDRTTIILWHDDVYQYVLNGKVNRDILKRVAESMKWFESSPD